MDARGDAAARRWDSTLATVRIYKVAELLDTTSQEVLALLKRDHGIELKSASSSLEEVVARSFVERVARQRGTTLPSGDMFADTPAPPSKSAPGKKPGLVKKAEPAKPAAPVLGPPRLVKVVRPVAPVADVADEDTPLAAAEAALELDIPIVEPEPVFVPPPAPVIEVVEEPVAPPPPVVEVPVEAPAPEPVVVAELPVAEEPVVAVVPEPVAAAPVTPAPPAPAVPAGRFVPPTIRLRIEEPGKLPTPARPTMPAKRPLVTQPRMMHPPAATPPPGTTRPGQPGAVGARPGAPRPPYQGPARPTTPSMLGGPRPLPSQPVRTQPGMPPRPGMPGARPPFGQQRPPFGQQRPGTRPTSTRRERP